MGGASVARGSGVCVHVDEDSATVGVASADLEEDAAGVSVGPGVADAGTAPVAAAVGGGPTVVLTPTQAEASIAQMSNADPNEP